MDNVESEFTFNEKVQIINGFYKGYYGKIKKMLAKDKYDVEVIMSDRPQSIICSVEQLRHVKSLGLFGL